VGLRAPVGMTGGGPVGSGRDDGDGPAGSGMVTVGTTATPSS